MSVEYAHDLGLREELDRLVGYPTAPASWSAVQDRVRRKRRRRRGAGALAGAAVVAAAGYGGWSLYSTANHDEPMLVITDATSESLTGVRAELWSEIQRVKEQSESGALAWADIERTRGAMASVWRGTGGSDFDLQSWLIFWSLTEQRLLTEDSVVEVTIYLKDDARPEHVSALHAEIAAMPGVKSVVYMSKTQALERLKHALSDRPEIFENLTGNPLPASLEIELADDVSPAAVAARLAGRPEIDDISYVASYEQLLGLLRGLTPSGSTTTSYADQAVDSHPETTSTTSLAASRVESRGLWAGNVETAPDNPASLPPEFYERPDYVAELTIGEPLWVFATELPPEKAAAAVEGAGDSQVILIFDPPEELCELLDIPTGLRPSFKGDLPSIFVQRPVLVRDRPFEDAPAHWVLSWLDLGMGVSAGADNSEYDPIGPYEAGAAETIWLEAHRRGLEQNAARTDDSSAALAGSTATMDAYPDPYPIFKDVESARAEELAGKAAERLRIFTGLSFRVDQAGEVQAIGANDVIEHLSHGAQLVVSGSAKKCVTYSVFWSEEDQLPGLSSANARGLHALFDVGADSKGVIVVVPNGYQAILQLADGMSVNVTSIGLDSDEAGHRAPASVVESSPLTPEQLIEFAKWLVVEGAYLRL
ncbi:MAG: hypothetical protein JXA87_00550 [Thermoleophilia bacterium]|nr:hypothetical protein [Thermoleophilia bacterium]